MVELVIEVKDGKAYLATWREDKDGIEIKRFTTPSVSHEDLEEAIKQANGSLNLNGTYPVNTEILRKVYPARKEGQPSNLDRKRFCEWI